MINIVAAEIDMFGVTAAAVSAGNHTIQFGEDCGAGSVGVGSFSLNTNIGGLLLG